MPILHKTVDGGALSNYFNDEKGFREVKMVMLNSDAVAVLERGLIEKYPDFRQSLDKSMSTEALKITGDSRFVYPLHVQFELTDGCNLICDYCYRDAIQEYKRAKFVDWPKLRNLLSELRDAGMSEIGITGGEATLHPQFASILAYAATNFEHVELIYRTARRHLCWKTQS